MNARQQFCVANRKQNKCTQWNWDFHLHALFHIIAWALRSRIQRTLCGQVSLWIGINSAAMASLSNKFMCNNRVEHLSNCALLGVCRLVTMWHESPDDWNCSVEARHGTSHWSVTAECPGLVQQVSHRLYSGSVWSQCHASMQSALVHSLQAAPLSWV